MKLLFSLLCSTLLLATALPAKAELSVDFFYDNLDAHGEWREVGDYGYCWQPRGVDRDWRPYSDGRWVYTDAGWTWDSDEPYSWAVYHYGRWARVDRIGWVWVPGTEWGPAWVSWRRSDRHVGWAPLPPEAEFHHSVGFSNRIDIDFDIGPTHYNFVEVRNFGAPRLRSFVIEPSQNITIINQTTNITRVTYVNNVVYNEGPRYEAISRESAQPIRRLRLERRQLKDDSRMVSSDQSRSRVEGDSLQVLAPPVIAKATAAPKKVAAKVAAPKIDRGWKNAGPPAEVAKVRTKLKSEKPAPAEPGDAPGTPPPPTATPLTESAAPIAPAGKAPKNRVSPPNGRKVAPGKKQEKSEVQSEPSVPESPENPVKTLDPAKTEGARPMPKTAPEKKSKHKKEIAPPPATRPQDKAESIPPPTAPEKKEKRKGKQPDAAKAPTPADTQSPEKSVESRKAKKQEEASERKVEGTMPRKERGETAKPAEPKRQAVARKGPPEAKPQPAEAGPTTAPKNPQPQKKKSKKEEPEGAPQ